MEWNCNVNMHLFLFWAQINREELFSIKSRWYQQVLIIVQIEAPGVYYV